MNCNYADGLVLLSDLGIRLEVLHRKSAWSENTLLSSGDAWIDQVKNGYYIDHRFEIGKYPPQKLHGDRFSFVLYFQDRMLCCVPSNPWRGSRSVEAAISREQFSEILDMLDDDTRMDLLSRLLHFHVSSFV